MSGRPVERQIIFLLSILIIFALAFAGFKIFTGRQADRAHPDPDFERAFLGPENSGLQVTPGLPDFSISKAQPGPPVRPASFDKDLRSLPQTGPTQKRPIPEIESPFRVKSAPSNAPDAVAQTTTGTLSMPAASVSFKGLDLLSWGAGWPPDTNGDVGPTYYIQTVNTSIGIFTKNGTRVAAFTFDNFFGGTSTPCDANNHGDPVVLYDAQSGRWIISDFAWSNFTSGPYYECIAVSKSGDPVSGGWWMYGFRADDLSHPYLNDYPKLGIWADGIYMSANMFDILNSNGSASYKGVRVWALNRDELASGASLNSVIFDLGSSYFSLMPSNYRGAQPPAGTPAFFASASSSSTNLKLWKFHVDWANQTASTLTGPLNVPIASFSQPSGQVPQLDSSETLDTLGDRLMVQLQYRYLNGVESLWTTHTVASGGVTGIRWYEIRGLSGTPSVYQQSTYQPDSLYRWMGSLAVDGQGNMAVGYSVTSSDIYPQIRYAGRLAGDSLNTLGQAESTLIAGTGSQSGGYNRWGDYSAMTVDPLDDCTFWYTTEYYEATGLFWQTRIASFKYPDCSPTPPGAFSKSAPSDGATGISSGPTLSWETSNGATGYEYCVDTTDDNACNNWTSNGKSTSVALSGLSADTPYYWQVRANNSLTSTYANGNETAFWSFTTGSMQGAFEKSAPSDGTSGVTTSPTLSWGASSGASSYEYCYDTIDDNVCTNWTDNGTNTSVTLNGLNPNTTYYWQVRANNSFGSTYAGGSEAIFWGFTTGDAPSAFSKMAPADGATGNSTSPALSWGTSAGATGYEYCLDTTNDSACSNWTSTGTNTSVALSGLSLNTTYYWQVRANNSFGSTYANGGDTAFWSFTTGNAPGVFSKMAPANGATGISTNPNLSWGTSTGATGYEYCFDTTNDSACSNWTSTGTNTSVALSGLSLNTTYYWQVRANNSFGTTYANGSESAFWSFTTGDLPGAFAKSALSDGATGVSTNPTLSWGASSGASSYDYCYDTIHDSACTNWTGSGTNTSVALNGLSLNTTYYWQVRANNGFGTTYANGSESAFWMFTTGSMPGAFEKSAPSDGATGISTGPSLSWGVSNGATEYEYCYDTTNDGACTSWTSNGTSTSAALSGLNPNTIYDWHVRANNSFGTTYSGGNATAFWSFTTQPAPLVDLAVNPGTTSVMVGQTFDLVIEVRAGTQAVDGAAAYLNFDPAFLQVVNITPGISLPIILENTYDNAAGQLNFSASTSSTPPSGTFTLATFTFKALVQTASTTLAFNTTASRISDATYGGSSVLKDLGDGTVTITISNRLFLPMLIR